MSKQRRFKCNACDFEWVDFGNPIACSNCLSKKTNCVGVTEFKFRAWQHHKDNDDTGWMTYYTIGQERIPYLTFIKSSIDTREPDRNFVKEHKETMDYALMLYTTRKDMDGKEIYGGDYLETWIARNQREIFRVQWKVNKFIWLRLNDGFYGRIKGDMNYEWQEIKWDFKKEKIRIIGNMYENPKLIPKFIKLQRSRNEEKRLRTNSQSG